MQQAINRKTGWVRVRELSLIGATLALFLGACNDDAIVYPNRNLRAPSGGATAEGGAAGDVGTPSAGTSHGGSAGKGTGGSMTTGGTTILGDDAGASGAATGPVCGDGVVEPPEECEDGNTVSGDGCSSDCKSSCERCERKVCPLLDTLEPITASAYDACYNVTGIIATGPAAGVSRAEVCRNLVDCIHRENCAQIKGYQLKTPRCWCDQDWNTSDAITRCQLEPDPNNPTDPTRFLPGKCAEEFQEASEGDTATAVLAGLSPLAPAEGIANLLLQNCDARDCAEECLPAYFEHGTAATITADIIGARNPAGESALGDLVADSQRSIAAADFALVSARFLVGEDEPQTDLPYTATPDRGADADGRVLWSEARAVHVGHAPGQPSGLPRPIDRPIETAIYKATFTGQQLYDALTQQLDPAAGGMLHVSGLSYTWDAAQPVESRLLEVRKDGVPLDKAATYTVALGGSLIVPKGPILALTNGSNPTLVPNADPVELLGEYLSMLPQPVSPPTLNRITRLN